MLTYFEAVGIQFDQLLCAVIFGVRGMTISLHAAIEAKAGRRWACWLCAFLNWAVQPNHCADQLAGAPMTTVNYLRAILALLTLAFGMVWLPALIIRALLRGV